MAAALDAPPTGVIVVPPGPPGCPPPETALVTYDGSTAVCCPPAPPGVGSKRSHPAPLNYNSGQAWASAVVTTHVPFARGCPAVKPIAIRDGMPMSRASTAIANANCWQ